MRNGLASCMVVCVVACLGACSGSSAAGNRTTAPKESPCPLVAQLDQTAAKLARADVSDPAAFQLTLAGAVDRYVATVRALRRVAPENLRPDLDRLEAAVRQYRFEDAASARASLDAFAASACGTRAAAASAGSNTGSTTTAVGP